MFLLPAVAAGLLLGLLLGGRLGELANLRLRAAWLFYAAIALQLIAYPTALGSLPVGDRAATALQIASYAGLVAVTLINARVPGMAVAGLGMLANLAAIVANGGHMPALPSALAGAGVSYQGVHNNSVEKASPSLPWLVDRWAAPGWLPWGNVFSAGDVLIAAGVIVIVAAAMRPRPRRLLRALRRAAASPAAPGRSGGSARS